jgi:hypothetical protein
MLVDGVVVSVRVSEDIVKTCEKIGSRQRRKTKRGSVPSVPVDGTPNVAVIPVRHEEGIFCDMHRGIDRRARVDVMGSHRCIDWFQSRVSNRASLGVSVSLLAFSFGLSDANMRIIEERGVSPEASNGAQRKERSQSRHPGQPLQFGVHRPDLTNLLGVFQLTENGCYPQAWPGAYVIDALMLNELLTQTPIAIYYASSRLPECIFLSVVPDDDALPRPSQKAASSL